LVLKKDVCANRRNANTLAAKEKTMQKAVRRDGLVAESLLVNIQLNFYVCKIENKIII